eukprot:6180611-Pleurochrysis_carterae.AAC.1
MSEVKRPSQNRMQLLAHCKRSVYCAVQRNRCARSQVNSDDALAYLRRDVQPSVGNASHAPRRVAQHAGNRNRRVVIRDVCAWRPNKFMNKRTLQMYKMGDAGSNLVKGPNNQQFVCQRMNTFQLEARRKYWLQEVKYPL